MNHREDGVSRATETDAPHTALPLGDDRIVRRAQAGGFLYPLFIAVLAIGTEYSTAQPLVLGCTAAVTVALALARIPVVRLSRSGAAAQWTVRLKWLITASGAVWGAFLTWTLLAFPHASPVTLLTLVCTAGTAGGSVSTHASDRRLSRWFLSLILAPPTFTLAMSGTTEGLALAAMFTLYLAYLLSQAAFEFVVFQRMEGDRELLALRAHDLEVACHAAEDANRAKSAFLAHMSHELRTPLTAIIGYAELLAEEDEAPEHTPRRQDLDRIATAGRRLLTLVTDLLDLSKIEAGRMAIDVTAFDAEELVRSTVTLMRPITDSAHNTVAFTSTGSIGVARSDRAKIRQIVLSLVGNACRFMCHGTMKVTVTREAGTNGDWLEVGVVDHGRGLSSEEIEQLFREFSIGDASGIRRYRGAGLGLAIAQRLAHLLGGEITAVSKPGVGSTFTLRVPALLDEHIDDLADADSPDVEVPKASHRPASDLRNVAVG